jgi:hypothetical protein
MIYLGALTMEKSIILKWMFEKCDFDSGRDSRIYASGERAAWISGSYETMSIS